MVRKLPSLDPYIQKRTGRGFSQGDMPTREEIDYAFERIHRHQDRLTRDLELEFQEIRASTSTPQVSIISQLNDVSVANATNNQVLTYISVDNKWIPTSIAELVGVRTSLSQLDDVSVSGATSGAFFRLEGDTWGPNDPSIDSLSDVSTGGAASGEVLRFDGSLWSPASVEGGGSSITSLSQLSDVSVSGATSGAFFRLEGDTWGPNDPSIDALSDVSTGGAASGEFLRFDGSLWSPASVAGGGSSVTSLSQLSDVSVSNATDNQVLTYVAANDEWVPRRTGVWEILTSANITDSDVSVPLFTNGDSASDFRLLQVFGYGVYGTGSGSIRFQLKSSQTSAWVTDNVYEWFYQLRNVGGSDSTNNSNTGGNVRMSDRCGVSITQPSNFWIKHSDPGNTLSQKTLHFDGVTMGSGNNPNVFFGVVGVSGVDVYDAIRFNVDTASIAGGTVEVWGVRK